MITIHNLKTKLIYSFLLLNLISFMKLTAGNVNEFNLDFKIDETRSDDYQSVEILKKLKNINIDIKNMQDFEAASKLYANLKQWWHYLYEVNTVSSWVAKAEILDKVDLLVERYFPDLTLFPFTGYPKSMTELGDASVFIPLVDYENLASVNQIPTHLLVQKTMVETLHSHSVLVQETSHTAKQIENIYGAQSQKPLSLSHIFSSLAQSAVIMRGLTQVLGTIAHKSLPSNKDRKSAQIAHFSIELGISPYEIFTQPNGQRFFHGPSFLFGKKIADYSTLNEWFVRDLTPEARKAYLADSKIKNNTSPVIISVSDSRVRLLDLEVGTLDSPQIIVGKVLNENELTKAKSRGDDPVYYSGSYQFTVRDLLAVETDTTLQTSEYSAKSILTAQKAYLKYLHNYMETTGWIQIIHRLAPADVHNYVAGMSGEILPPLASLDYLESKDIFSGTDDKDELFHLKKVFAQQVKELGRNPQASLDIYGTNASVSTLAVKHKPNILTQNDRKIMVIKSIYGDLSIHIFIGATGVNKVAVNPIVQAVTQGGNLGNMGFGPDNYGKDNRFLSSTDRSTRDGLPKLLNVDMGEHVYTESINGSTVISYYMRSAYQPIPIIQEFMDKFNDMAEVPEILTKMGRPLLERRTMEHSLY